MAQFLDVHDGHHAERCAYGPSASRATTSRHLAAGLLSTPSLIVSPPGLTYRQ